MSLGQNKNVYLRTSAFRSGLFVLIVCYLLGSAAGLFAPTSIANFSFPELSTDRQSFLTYVWFHIRLLPIAFLFGYTAIGVLVQPVLLALAGYMLSASFVNAFAAADKAAISGFVLNNSLTGIAELFFLFLLGSSGFCRAWSAMSNSIRIRSGQVYPMYTALHFGFFVFGIIAVLMASILNLFLYAMFF